MPLDKPKSKEALKPFGARADKDIDNDGKVTKSDKYLHLRRKKIAQSKKKKDGANSTTSEDDKLTGNKDTINTAPTDDSIKGGVKVNQESFFNNNLSTSQSMLDAINSILEKSLTAAELKKREEVVKSLKKQGMDKSKAYAIATSVAKRVAEDSIDEYKADTKKTPARKGDYEDGEKTIVKQGSSKVSEKGKEPLAEKVLPHEIHISHSDKKKNGLPAYRVHAVGSKFAHGVKAGEHLTDTELDDYHEMGGKVKMLNGVNIRKKRPAVKEDVEQVDELSKKTLKSYEDKTSMIWRRDGFNKAQLRRLDHKFRVKNKTGGTSLKDYSAEDVERVDELSNETLRSYMGKAHRQTKSLPKKLAKSMAQKPSTSVPQVSHPKDKDSKQYGIKRQIAKRTWGKDKARAKLRLRQGTADALAKVKDVHDRTNNAKSFKYNHKTGLAFEEVERVDELSKGATPGRKKQKASRPPFEEPYETGKPSRSAKALKRLAKHLARSREKDFEKD